MEDNRSICKKRGIGEDTRGFGKMGRGKGGRSGVGGDFNARTGTEDGDGGREGA